MNNTTCPLEIAKRLKEMGIQTKTSGFYVGVCHDTKGLPQAYDVYYSRRARWDTWPLIDAPQLHDLPEILKQIGDKKGWGQWVAFDYWKSICAMWFVDSPSTAWDYLNNLLD